jgi:hypothetical protein
MSPSSSDTAPFHDPPEASSPPDGTEVPGAGGLPTVLSSTVDSLHVERWTTAAGRPVRMLTAGRLDAERPQVVLLPGLDSMGYLLEVLHACSGWTRTTLLDLPGFGHRRTADLPADLDSLTETLAAVVEALPGPRSSSPGTRPAPSWPSARRSGRRSGCTRWP